MLVSVWQASPVEDRIVGEAAVPMDDVRIAQTNPWPLREAENNRSKLFIIFVEIH